MYITKKNVTFHSAKKEKKDIGKCLKRQIKCMYRKSEGLCATGKVNLLKKTHCKQNGTFCIQKHQQKYQLFKK